MYRLRRLFQNALLVLISLVVSVVLLEVALRLLPNQYRMQWRHFSDNQTKINYRQTGGGLYQLQPNQKAVMHKSCLKVGPIYTNEYGYRDASWPVKNDGFRIAALGDSFLEAMHVPDGEDVSARLEELTGYEVLNAGISGYSTVTELEAYRRYIRPLQPDLVLLFMFIGNDIRGNSCVLDPAKTLCAEIADGEVLYKSGDENGGGEETRAAAGNVSDSPLRNDSLSRFKKYFRKRLVLYGAFHDLKMISQALINQLEGRVLAKWRIYIEDNSSEWTDAWTITADAISVLKKEVGSDGAQLAIVAVPESFSLSHDWKRDLMFGGGTAVPEGFDRFKPLSKLAEIAAREGIPLLDPVPALISYRDSVDLGSPYFSYSCDGHWNPLAHFLVAHELAVFLGEQGLLPMDMEKSGKSKEKRQRAFLSEPEEILGNTAYRQIYEGGIYTGGGGN